MKKFLLPALFVLLSFSLSAQSTRTREVIQKQQQPLIIVDSVETDYNHMLLKPERIQSLNVINDSNAVAIYGEKAKYGAIIIRTKKNTEVANINDVLANFNVPESDRKLKIALDNILVKDTTKLIIDKQDIKNVQVITDVLWYGPTQAGDEERYINISLKK